MRDDYWYEFGVAAEATIVVEKVGVIAAYMEG